MVSETRRRITSLGRMINETTKNKKDLDEKRNEDSDIFYCDSNSRLTFASSDVHDGPRTDISFTLLKMNQSFVHLGPRNATKNYPQGNQINIFRIYAINKA